MDDIHRISDDALISLDNPMYSQDSLSGTSLHPRKLNELNSSFSQQTGVEPTSHMLHFYFSLRLSDTSPINEALEVRKILKSLGFNSMIGNTDPHNVALGDDNVIVGSFNDLSNCKVAILFANETYGENTPNDFNTFKELQYVITHNKPFVLINMCEEYQVQTTKYFLPQLLPHVFWKVGQPMPPNLIETIMSKYHGAMGNVITTTSNPTNPLSASIVSSPSPLPKIPAVYVLFGCCSSYTDRQVIDTSVPQPSSTAANHGTRSVVITQPQNTSNPPAVRENQILPLVDSSNNSVPLIVDGNSNNQVKEADDELPSGVFSKSVEMAGTGIDAYDQLQNIESYWSQIESIADSAIVQSILSPEATEALAALSVVANVAVKGILQVSVAIPFAGPIAMILLGFYGAISQTLANNKDLYELQKDVDNFATWLTEVCKKIQLHSSHELKPSDKMFKSIKLVSYSLGEASTLVIRSIPKDNDKLTTKFFIYAKRVALHESETVQLSHATDRLRRARNDLSAEVPLFLFQVIENRILSVKQSDDMMKLKDVLPDHFRMFSADMEKHLRKIKEGSRQWMHDMVTNFVESSTEADKKLFWICADAGMGKSAFAAMVVQNLTFKHQLLAVFFCVHSDKKRSDAFEVIKSIAYQIAVNLPECRDDIYEGAKLLKNNNESEPRLDECFTLLITKPLENYTTAQLALKNHENTTDTAIAHSSSSGNNSSHKTLTTRIILIDAIDEIDKTEKNRSARVGFLNLIKKCLKQLPKWVKVILTSRPEIDIMEALRLYHPIKIEANDIRHKQDLEEYIQDVLTQSLIILPTDTFIIHQQKIQQATQLLCIKSEFKFIYIAMLIEENFYGDQKWTIEELHKLPNGLNEKYEEYFKRVEKMDPLLFQTKIQFLLQFLVAMQEPLPVSLAQSFLGVSDVVMKKIQSQISSMFPVKGGGGRGGGDGNAVNDNLTTPFDVIAADAADTETVTNASSSSSSSSSEAVFDTFHKSLIDWLKDEEQNERYYVNETEGHDCFINQFLTQIDQTLTPWDFTAIQHDYVYTHFINHAVRSRVTQVTPTTPTTTTATTGQDIATIFLWELSWLMVAIDKIGPYALMNDVKTVLLTLSNTNNNNSSSNSSGNIGQKAMKKMNAKDDKDDDRKELKLLLKSIKLSLNTLQRKDKYISSNLPLQLYGRLQSIPSSFTRLHSLFEQSKSWLQKTNVYFPTLFPLSSPLEPLELTVRFPYGLNTVAALSQQRIVSGCRDGNVYVFNEETGETLITLTGHTEEVLSLVVYADNTRIVSASADKTIKVWSVESGDCLRTLVGHTEEVTSVAVFPDGRIVSGSKDCTVRIWTAVSGGLNEVNSIKKDGDGDNNKDCLYTLAGHTESVTAVLTFLSPAGNDNHHHHRIISASKDKSLKVWSIDDMAVSTASEPECILTITEEEESVYALALLSADRVIGAVGSNLNIWNIVTGECVGVLTGHQNAIWTVAVLADGRRVVSGSSDQTVRVFDTYTKECLRTMTGHANNVNGVAVLSSGRVVSGSNDYYVKVWELETSEMQRDITATNKHRDEVNSVAVLADTSGRVVTGSRDTTIKVWSSDTGDCLLTLTGHNNSVSVLVPLTDGSGRVVSGSADRSVRVWDTNTGQCKRTLTGHNFMIRSIELLQRGYICSTDFPGNKLVFHVDTGEKLTMDQYKSKVPGMNFNNNRPVFIGNREQSELDSYGLAYMCSATSASSGVAAYGMNTGDVFLFKKIKVDESSSSSSSS